MKKINLIFTCLSVTLFGLNEAGTKLFAQDAGVQSRPSLKPQIQEIRELLANLEKLNLTNLQLALTTFRVQTAYSKTVQKMVKNTLEVTYKYGLKGKDFVMAQEYLAGELTRTLEEAFDLLNINDAWKQLKENPEEAKKLLGQNSRPDMRTSAGKKWAARVLDTLFPEEISIARTSIREQVNAILQGELRNGIDKTCDEQIKQAQATIIQQMESLLSKHLRRNFNAFQQQTDWGEKLTRSLNDLTNPPSEELQKLKDGVEDCIKARKRQISYYKELEE